MSRRKSIKKVAAFILSIGVVFTAVGCGSSGKDSTTGSGSEQSSSVKETDKITVRVGCVGDDGVLSDAIGIAQENGYLKEEFEKAGYDVEVIGFAQAGPAINEAFLADQIDLAVYGDLPATVCKSNGGETTVFGIENDQQQMGILAQKDSGIKSAADLAGHKVIVAVGTIYQQYFKAIIERAGVKESDVEQINTFSDATSIMASGDADALITSTSIANYMEQKGVGEVVETSESDTTLTSQFFFVGNTKFLKENSGAAKAMIKAALRGKEYMQENKKESYQLFADRSNGYDVSVYEKIYAYDESFDYLNPVIDQDNKDRYKNLLTFMKEQQLLTSDVDADAFIDDSYSKEALSEYESEIK